MTKNISLLSGILLFLILSIITLSDKPPPHIANLTPQPSQQVTLPSSPSPTPMALPNSKTLTNDYHVFQTFNNCGPASLSMALSYFGINISQQSLGQDLRPYQNPQGDNDDKSVTLEELASKAEEFGLIAYHRPNGNPEIVKQFINLGVPIITRTWTKPNEDIGHFRVIKGYNDIQSYFVQDDSLQGKSLQYSYDDFDVLWKKFNYEYLALISPDQQNQAEQILGDNLDEKYAWRQAINLSQKQLSQNPNDIYARFNLSVAYYQIGNFQASVSEFEKVENQLPFRTLWYQIEPIQAYFELGQYERVFEITNKVLSNFNRAFSEVYIIRGNMYKLQGQTDLAKSEYEKAVLYNRNLEAAKQALNSLN